MSKGILKIKVLGDASHLDKALSGNMGTLAKWGKAAALAGAAVAAGVVAVGVKSVKAFAEFDAAMTESTAIMGDLSDVMKNEMSDAAREVGKTTLFSATQAAESYYFLASAGLTAAQSIAAMPQVAQFAQAGMFDMATATDLLTDAQSALGLKSDDVAANMENMARVSDVLTKAGILSNATVQQFSESLTNKAASAMKVWGIEMEEGVAVLAAFADQGVKGEDAGTKFEIVLRDLMTQGLKNRDVFEEFGVAVYDANDEVNNMGDIVGQLERALDGMSDAQRKATLMQMGFTDKSMSAILALMGTSEAIKKYETGLREAGGITEEVAGKQLESLSAQFQLLKSKVMDVAITIGEKLAPVLLKFMDWVNDHMPEIERVVGVVMKGIGDAFAKLKPVLAPVLKALVGFYKTVWAGFKKGGISGAFQSMGTAWAKALPAILNALAGLGKKILKWLGTLVKPLVSALWDVLKALGAWLGGTALPYIWENLGKWAKAFVDWIKPLVAPMLRELAGVLVAIVRWIFTDAIPGIAKGLAQLGWELIKGIGAGFAALGVWLYGKGGEVLTEFLDGVKDIFWGVLDWFAGIGTRVKNAVVGAGTWLWDKGKAVINGMVLGIVAAFWGVVDWFKALPGKVKDFFVNAATWLWSAGRAIIQGIWDGMTSKWDAFIAWVKSIPGKIKNAITGQSDTPTITYNAIGEPIAGNANGGFITSPTVSMVGEAGRELILPLTRPARTQQLLEQAGLTGGTDGRTLGLLEEIRDSLSGGRQIIIGTSRDLTRENRLLVAMGGI